VQRFGWRYVLCLFGALGVVALVCTVGLDYAPKIVDAVKRAEWTMRKTRAEVSGRFAPLVREAEAAEAAGDHPRAIELYSSALADASISNDDRRSMLRGRAYVLEWARRYPDAEADWSAALAIEPVDPVLYYRRGLFYQRRERHDEALADFAAGKRIDPRDPWFSYGEGGVRAVRQEHRLTIAAYSEAIRLKPDMMRAYLGRASAYNYEKMYQEAHADYDRVILDRESKGSATRYLQPRDIGLAYLGRGYARNHLGDYRGAKDDFDKVLGEQPRSSNALMWRGYALEQLGDRERALADYRAALVFVKTDEWLSERVRALEGR
jgi:tetratricopeptide (TPR) repeat protein